MHEIDEGIAALSDTEIILEYRQVLIAILPSCVRLGLLTSDDQPYDYFEDLAAMLWKELVQDTFAWKYGETFHLPEYGSLASPSGPPFVAAVTPYGTLAMSEFSANRSFGKDSFNSAVVWIGDERRELPITEITSFELRRG